MTDLKHIKAILFDLDGVVVDSEKLWDKSQDIFLGRRNLKYDREKIKHLISGRNITEGTEIIKKITNIDGELKDLTTERRNIIAGLFREHIDFMPGFERFMTKMSGRYAVAIATSMEPGLLQIVIEKICLQKYFGEHIYKIMDVGYKSKPDPAIFLYAANKLGFKPEECIIIEDAPNGIEAAHRAGIICIGLATTFDRSLLEKTRPDYVADNYEDIEKILEKTQKK
jgi:beta-phosphoglucomutase